MEENENLRVFVDLNVKGNASGTTFIKNKILKDTIDNIEELGIDRVVGVVFDGTENLEILTQPVEDLGKLKMIEGQAPVK